MNLILMTLAFLVLALLGTAGYLLFSGPESLAAQATWTAMGDHLASVPDGPAALELARTAGVRGAELEASYGHWLGSHRDTLRPLWGLLVLRSEAAWTAAPLLGAATVAGILLGLTRRERSRAEYAYSSATWSYVGKILFSLSLAGYLATGFAPVGLPIWMLYVFIATGSFGKGLYFAHLPPKF